MKTALDLLITLRQVYLLPLAFLAVTVTEIRADYPVERAVLVKPETSPVRLFGMPGLLQNPLGIHDDDDTSRFDDEQGMSAASQGDQGFSFSMGRYNPLLEPRRPEDWSRNLGFYKVHSEMQVADLGTDSFFMNLGVLTPAGIQDGGLATGPTVISSGVNWFHDFGAGAGVRGFLGQDVLAHSHWRDELGSRLQVGLGVQHPIPTLTTASGDSGWFVFVQVMNYSRPEESQEPRGNFWDVVPGVHWRANENCWLSVGVSRWSLLSCSLEY